MQNAKAENAILLLPLCYISTQWRITLVLKVNAHWTAQRRQAIRSVRIQFCMALVARREVILLVMCVLSIASFRHCLKLKNGTL